MSEKNSRAVWGSKFGFLMAAIGSAVGLGNIWRFSYITYENGGGAFLIPYIFALVVAGIPLIILEFSLGHMEKGSAPLSFSRHHKSWEWIGWWMPTVATIGIQLFYSIVIAWCLKYFIFSFNLAWGADTSSFFYNDFLKLSSGPTDIGGINYSIAVISAVVWFITWLICFKEVNHGIEKACSVFMPLLFILTAILVGWSLTLDGALNGIKVYLIPDWNKLMTYKPWVDAFGQIFFTLSLGFGIMITYASYLPKKADLVGNAIWTSIANCSYSLFTGFAVFGTLGFMAAQKGVSVSEIVKGGPGLAFVVYPEAINNIPIAGNWFGVAFFLALVIAGLSSAISLIEAFACSITDKFDVDRKKVVSIICIIGFAVSLIYTTNAGLYILDIVDHFITNYALVLGGLLECLFVGWVIKADTVSDYVNSLGMMRLIKAWDYCIKYVTPVVLIIILFNTFSSDFQKAYGGYAKTALWGFGGGMLFFTLVLAVYFSVIKWKASKPEHKPGEDELLT